MLDVGCGRGRHLHELGDTLCQTDGMMGRYFRNNQLEIELAPASRRFLGLQVFHYYVLRKQ